MARGVMSSWLRSSSCAPAPSSSETTPAWPSCARAAGGEGGSGAAHAERGARGRAGSARALAPMRGAAQWLRLGCAPRLATARPLRPEDGPYGGAHACTAACSGVSISPILLSRSAPASISICARRQGRRPSATRIFRRRRRGCGGARGGPPAALPRGRSLRRGA